MLAANPHILVVTIAVVGACSRDREYEERSGSPNGRVRATVENVSLDSALYDRRRVTLRGEVGDIANPRAFFLADDDWICDETIPVVARTPIRPSDRALESGDEVMVSGTVRKLARHDLSRELGWDPTTLRADAVVVADTVRPLVERSLWSDAR
ncbi:MAG: hypothetical protein H0T42_30655 [Deltaproteobacteria bacterium]|nr:hypothetical protein [Deltaproteobacteria bacterium]